MRRIVLIAAIVSYAVMAVGWAVVGFALVNAGDASLGVVVALCVYGVVLLLFPSLFTTTKVLAARSNDRPISRRTARRTAGLVAVVIYSSIAAGWGAIAFAMVTTGLASVAVVVVLVFFCVVIFSLGSVLALRQRRRKSGERAN